MTDTTTPQPTATPLASTIELRVTGRPDVPNKHGSGHIRPTEVTFRYQAGGIRAQVYGRWVRGTELTDAPISQDYTAHAGDTDGWPQWLAEMAREHTPANQRSGQTTETRVSYLLETRMPQSDTWQRIGLNVTWEDRAKADLRLASANETHPDRQHRLITRTVVITEEPTQEA